MDYSNIEKPAKKILDKYRPLIIRKDKVFLKNGIAQVNTSEPEQHEPLDSCIHWKRKGGGDSD